VHPLQRLHQTRPNNRYKMTKNAKLCRKNGTENWQQALDDWVLNGQKYCQQIL